MQGASSLSNTADPGLARSVRRLIGVGFFVSGAAGLIDQVVWSRYLALFIGGSTAALTIVLATFMGGLALGNHVFGRRADRVRNPLMLYAALEVGIGIYCFLFPEIFALFSDGYVGVAGPMGFGAPGTTAVKLVLAAASILLPTFLMGGTLPVLARFIVRDLSDITPSVGRLYTVNSFGAAFGAAAGGFFLIPALGLDPTLRLSGLLNLALAAAFYVAGRRLGQPSAAAVEAEAAASSSPPRDGLSFTPAQRRVVLTIIGVSGAVSMLYEVVWVRLVSLVMGSSTYSFTIMVMTFIAGITLGSFYVSRRLSERGRGGDPVWLLSMAYVGVFATILPLIPLYDRLPYYFGSLASVIERTPDAFPIYLTMKVVVAFALMFLPTFFIGMTLPLASRVAVDDMKVLGKRVGSVFSINTLGTVLGASLTGLVLLPALGLRTTLALGVGLSGSLAIASLVIVRGRSQAVRLGIPAGLIAAFLVVVLAFPAWNALVLNFGIYRHKSFAVDSYDELLDTMKHFELLEANDGADTSVAILKDRRTDRIYMKVNGKTDAGTGEDMTTQLWLGHLGMFLNPKARRALVIGLGSGITAGSVLAHPDAEVDVVEISDAVVRGARFFAEHNGDAMNNERFTLHVGDAKEFFKLRPDDRWDVVVSEPSNPWISGIGNLFSQEYFQDIAGHLGEGGVLVQWVHLYELNDELLSIILNTVGSVFGQVEVWQVNSDDVLVVASRTPIQFDAAHVDARLADARVAADLNRSHLHQRVETATDIAANQALSAERLRRFFPGDEPHNRDTHPILEYRAPRAFFANERSEIVWRLDERRVSTGQAGTHLAKLIRTRPPGPDQMKRLVSTLEGRGGTAAVGLLRSLAWAWQAAAPKDPFGQELFRKYGDAETDRALTAANPSVRAGARAAMISQATSTFFSIPAAALQRELQAAYGQGPLAGDPQGVANALAALVQAGAPRLVEAWSTGATGDVLDPLGVIAGSVPLTTLRDYLVAEAWLRAGQPACALPALERFVQAAPERFPGPQLLATSKAAAQGKACTAR